MPSAALPARTTLSESIRNELIDQWMNDTPKRVPIVPLCALLVAATLHGAAPARWLWLWLGAIAVISGWRLLLYRWYRQAAPDTPTRVALARDRGLLRQVVVCVTLLGLAWGMCMVLGFQFGAGEPAVLATVGVITAAMAVVTIGGMFPQAGLMMTLGIFAPFEIWSFWHADRQVLMLAFGGLVYIAILIVWSRGLYRNVVDTMLLRHENDELVRELSRAKDEAERANLEKSRFLAAASHDLRQPMQGLWLFVGNLRQQWGRPQAERILDHIEHSLDAMRAMFDSLLNIAQLDSGGVRAELQAVPVQASLDRLRNEFSAECDRKLLRFKVWPSRAWVRTDPGLLDRILLNFLSNAVKYTAAGGGILVACRRRGTDLEVQVWDTGLGIDPSHHAAIFDEFVQLNNPERDRNKGLGLGLAISRRLAQLLGARLQLRSVSGRGSMFSVTVPLATAQSPASAAPRGPSPSLAGLRLAFVDDESSILDAVRSLCEAWDVQCITAQDAATLLQVLGDQPPDLLITDHRLRGQQTGLTLIQDLRQRWPNLPAALLTGETAPGLEAEVRALGVRLIYKPISAEALATTLRASVPGGTRPVRPASGS